MDIYNIYNLFIGLLMILDDYSWILMEQFHGIETFFFLLGCTGVTGEKTHGVIEFVGLLDVVVPR